MADHEPRTSPMRARVPAAFTLIEVLISVGVIAVLISLLAPALGSARETARTTACLSNQRQLVLGWMLYADAHQERAMPLAEDGQTSPGAWGMTYWWGEVSIGQQGLEVLHSRGFLTPYLEASLHTRSVYECPSQPWGTYRAQPIGAPRPGTPTSTYGYNGYYLSPARTPGWSSQIGHQRWKRLSDIEQPAALFVFADTLLPGSPQGLPMNNALLDPPMLFTGNSWAVNDSPTTAFRHGGRAGSGSQPVTAAARADGSAGVTPADPEALTHPQQRIGSVGTENDPHYVPDWKRWR